MEEFKNPRIQESKNGKGILGQRMSLAILGFLDSRILRFQTTHFR